ncbi:MAG: TlpA disulfide reductase family protein [Legionellales bacterium]|nr:TlpA disulfide reductase family protein [Legionellales bacterium]
MIKRIFLFLLFFTSLTHATAHLQDMSGKSIALSDLKGKWIFINYWASWCHTCLKEIPELNRFYDEHQPNDVALFAVNYDGLPLEKLQELIKAVDMHYPSLSTDPAGELQLGDIRGVPVTFVFDPKGQLTETLYGGQNRRALEKITSKKLTP